LAGWELLSEYEPAGGDVELPEVLLVGAGSCLENGDRALELRISAEVLE
jgi:hypothetical protein